MENALWTPTASWLAAASIALGLAMAAPTEGWVLGRVPAVHAKRLDQTSIALPHELPSGRTLALVLFDREQRAQVQSWIDGLQLRRDASIAWLKLPVLEDPGDAAERGEIERALAERHAASADRDRLVPLFTNRAAFVRSAGLSGTSRAAVLVLDRRGQVVARAEGPFDPRKAQALRETVLARDD